MFINYIFVLSQMGFNDKKLEKITRVNENKFDLNLIIRTRLNIQIQIVFIQNRG